MTSNTQISKNDIADLMAAKTHIAIVIAILLAQIISGYNHHSVGISFIIAWFVWSGDIVIRSLLGGKNVLMSKVKLIAGVIAMVSVADLLNGELIRIPLNIIFGVWCVSVAFLWGKSRDS